MANGYWLAEDVVIELHNEGLPNIVVPKTRHRLQLGLRGLLLLCEVACFNSNGKATTLEDLEADPDLFELISQLKVLGVLIEQDERPKNNDKTDTMLSLLEGATLRMSQIGGCFTSSLPKNKMAPPIFQARNNSTQCLSLPKPVPPAGVELWDTLMARRSNRTGPRRSISITSLSTLLSYSLKIQDVKEGAFGEVSIRPVASGGARHPIDIFIAALRVSELKEGVYQYNPLMHQVVMLDNSPGTALALSRAALTAVGELSDMLPALTLFFSAVPARTACKYEDNALSLLMSDLGCIIQQLYLVVQGLGLVGCAVGIGGAEPTTVEKELLLHPSQEFLVGGFVIW